MSIKKSQAILKCFIDLKSSVCLALGSENETMLCDSYNFFSGRLPGSPVFSINLTYLRIPNEAKESTLMSSQKRQVQVMKF